MSIARRSGRKRFVGLGMAVLLFFVAAGEITAQERRSIQVQGYATMSVEPDIAYLSLGVETQGDTAAKAQGLLAERASNVLAALSRAGIERSKVKTSSYRVSPVYSTRQDKQNVVIGYRAETTISVEVEDIPSVATLVDAAMAAGANAVRSLSYDRKDMGAFKAALIQAACRDARLKADTAAEALAVQIGVPLSVDIQDSWSVFRAESGTLKAASQDFLSPGELDVSVSVSIVFDLLAE